METYTKLTVLKHTYPRLVVALGMFDGVHIGHQSIIRRAVELARSIDGKCLVFTFSNHPRAIFAPDSLPPVISSARLRQQHMEELGVDLYMAIPFTREFAKHSPEDFLAMLQSHFAPRYVVTGPNYTFGCKGKGSDRTLLREAQNYGFQAEICPAVLRGGRPVSSTRIRRLILAGDLETAEDFLGRPFTVLGRVIHGDQRGRTIGFPTANLAIPDDRVMLPNGVYAAEVLYEGQHYLGLANIGNNPTFEGCNRRLEVNLQGFHADIYDRLIEVRFRAKLRDEIKFPSVEALVTQMHKDKAHAIQLAQKWQLR